MESSRRKTAVLLTIPRRAWYYSPAQNQPLAGRPLMKRGESYQR
jgi:hypothetical protein